MTESKTVPSNGEFAFKPNSKAHMDIGMKIAQSHEAVARKIVELNGEWNDNAVTGCVVWLAAEIMKALDECETKAAQRLESSDQISGAMVEAAARAIYLKLDGSNPDWPIGVDKNGYAQEPYVSHVPSWKWKYEAIARAALTAAANARVK